MKGSSYKPRNYYKPSKELLREMLSYLPVESVAVLCGVSATIIKKLSAYYKLKGRLLYLIRTKNKSDIPDFRERIKKDQEEFYKREKITFLEYKIGAEECLTVPDEVFQEPEPVEEVPELPGINTHDIKAFINSGSVMDYLYMRQPKQRDPECRKIANRMRVRDVKKIKQRINIAGIAQMKKDLNTKEKFLKATYGHNKSKAVAREYGITDKDLAEQRETLFAGMKPAEIRELRKKVTAPVFVGNGSEVKVYKIIDKEALEKEIREHKFGEPVSYDHLEFDRIEYGKPFSMPFNAALEMEG